MISAFRDSNRTIGLRIRALRLNAGLTQQKTAEDIDISDNYLSQIERGIRPLTLPVAEQLCLLFHVTYDYLYLGLSRPISPLSGQRSRPVSACSEQEALINLVLSSTHAECSCYWSLLRAANTLREMPSSDDFAPKR